MRLDSGSEARLAKKGTRIKPLWLILALVSSVLFWSGSAGAETDQSTGTIELVQEFGPSYVYGVQRVASDGSLGPVIPASSGQLGPTTTWQDSGGTKLAGPTLEVEPGCWNVFTYLRVNRQARSGIETYGPPAWWLTRDSGRSGEYITSMFTCVEAGQTVKLVPGQDQFTYPAGGVWLTFVDSAGNPITNVEATYEILPSNVGDVGQELTINTGDKNEYNFAPGGFSICVSIKSIKSAGYEFDYAWLDGKSLCSGESSKFTIAGTPTDQKPTTAVIRLQAPNQANILNSQTRVEYRFFDKAAPRSGAASTFWGQVSGETGPYADDVVYADEHRIPVTAGCHTIWLEAFHQIFASSHTGFTTKEVCVEAGQELVVNFDDLAPALFTVDTADDAEVGVPVSSFIPVKVEDSAGKPVAGVDIRSYFPKLPDFPQEGEGFRQIDHDKTDARGQTVVFSNTTDDQGQAVLPAWAPCYVVELASADQSVTFANGTSTMRTGACTGDELSVTVTSSTETKITVPGRVIKADGSGVAGTSVDLFTEGRAEWLAYATPKTTDGSFSFEVEPGCYVLTYIAPDGEAFNTGKYKNQRFCANDSLVTLDTVTFVSKDLRIAGEVLDRDGKPVKGVNVELFTENRGQWLTWDSTDSGGDYSFAVDAGCYVVTFYGAPGQTFTESGKRWFNVPVCVDDSPKTSITATLDGSQTGEDSFIEGKIATTLGPDIPPVQVDLFTSTADGSRATYLKSVNSDSTGSFRFDLDEPGCYVLTYIAPQGTTFKNGRYQNQSLCADPNTNDAGVELFAAYSAN